MVLQRPRALAHATDAGRILRVQTDPADREPALVVQDHSPAVIEVGELADAEPLRPPAVDGLHQVADRAEADDVSCFGVRPLTCVHTGSAFTTTGSRPRS